MSRWSRMAALATATVVAGLALTGCGGEPEPAPSSPPGAVMLRENVPTPVGDLTVIASNIWDDSIALSVRSGSGPAESADLTVGETATVMGQEFELVSVHEDDGDAAPGGSASFAWVVPGT
ncbi:hypothetical protein ACTHAM_000662 [Cellulomonas soli]|uniref:hypothetical protein n=1 Tax=Cellulomonas soli TaxID=931535 RepID=UPI003F82F5BE